jgi:pimeloyl-ACP methyl ester carboxylesterase
VHHRFTSDAMQSPSQDPSSGNDASLAEAAARQERVLDAEFSSRPVTVGQGADGQPVDVVVRELGHGPQAVVMLHGIGSGSATWMNVALELARLRPGVHVVSWDAPGYAESTPLPLPQPKGSDYAARLGELLRALKIRSVVLVGHSLGAFTAAATAQALGLDIVKCLVLVSPAGGYGGAGQEAQRAKVYAQRIGHLQDVGIAGMAEAIGKPGARMCSPDASVDARAWVQWNMARLNEVGYRQAVEMLCGDTLANYAPVGVPAQVHVGDHDIVTPPEQCAAWAATFSASFSSITGPGHASPIEAPEAVAAFIAAAASDAFGPAATDSSTV